MYINDVFLSVILILMHIRISLPFDQFSSALWKSLYFYHNSSHTFNRVYFPFKMILSGQGL